MQIIQHGIVLCGGAKVVCYATCVRIWKTFSKIRWDQEEVVFRDTYATQRIAKEGVSRQLDANLENILKTR